MNTKKIVGKLLVALTLCFTIPQLVFFYIWEDLSSRASTLLLSSTVLLTSIGIFLVWDIIQSIRSIFNGIANITQEELKSDAPAGQVDEFQLMDNSIEMISQKIVENMEDLQRSAAIIERTKKDLNGALMYNENVMDSMGDALVVIDTENRIKRMNTAAKKLLDFHIDNFLGQPIDLFFEKGDAVHFSEDKIITGKRMTFIGTKGVRIPVDVNIRPLKDPRSGHIGHVLVARDLRKTLSLILKLKETNKALESAIQKRATDIDQAHEEIKTKDAQVLLQEKMAAISVLTTGITHEINNPLGYISSNLEILQKDFDHILSYTQLTEYEIKRLTEEDDKERRAEGLVQFKKARAKMKIENHLSDFGTILKESSKGLDRIKGIISDLKRYSHTDNMEMRSVNLNEEIQGALNIVRHDLKDKTKVIRKFGPLPQVRCYANQINQVFMNILINASQALKAGGTITISSFASEETVSVLIQDTGPGISPENIKNIFKPFFTTKSARTGTGLGLYLSQNIIESHHGTLSVESRLGEGTAFMISLPALVPHLGASHHDQYTGEKTLPAA